jgi:hypothetical protein
MVSAANQAEGNSTQSAEPAADDSSQPEAEVADAGVGESDAGPPSSSNGPEEADIPNAGSEKSEKKTEAKSEEKLHWRKDPSVLRHPGSYLGGGMAYTMAFAWYTYEQRDFSRDYAIGPVHSSSMFLRAGDAFFEWLAVGFQVHIISGTYAGTKAEGTAGFGLLVDTTLYPWKGLGIRPSVGLGFGYAQAGAEEYKFGFGGPACLSLSLTHEFRIARLITLGPVVQVSWIVGQDYDSLYVTFGLELLKWFMTAEG